MLRIKPLRLAGWLPRRVCHRARARKAQVEAGKLLGKDKIGVAVGKVVNQYKVAKHFELTITDDALTFARLAQNISTEAALDGLYIIRTSVKTERMDAAACVSTYKSLAQVERAFLSMKMMDLKVHPIHHHIEGRVFRAAHFGPVYRK